MVIIKEPAKMRKERRTRVKLTPETPEFKIEQRTEAEKKNDSEFAPTTKAAAKNKIELKDIEQKLDEILGE